MRERALQAYPESEGSLKRTPPAGAVVLTAWHVRALWAIELSTDRIALIGVLGIIADAGQSRHRAAPRGKEIPAFLLEFSALAVIHTKKGTRTPVRPGSFSCMPPKNAGKSSKVKLNRRNAYNTMNSMGQSKVVVVAIITLIVGGLAGYWYGGSSGYERGYKKAEADIKAIEQASAQKAAEEAAKAANPFQAVNPLEGVEANPFKKAKKVLNPFE